jgi:mono/diheme cytochrome c family protein
MDPSHPPANDPDSREGRGVAESHAAAAREKADPALGSGTVSLWTFLVCSAILLFAGGYVGDLSGGFRNNQFVKLGYMPQLPPGMDAAALSRPWIDDYMALGKKRYGICAGCHGADGNGTPVYPPLAGSEWVVNETEKLALIILAGLQGPVTVKGKTYINNMPSQAAGLGPNELGAVMTYIRRSFGNEASIVTPEMAQAALDLYDAHKAAGKGQFTAEELLASHRNMLPGDEVDPQTGKPAAAAPPAADAPAGEAAPADAPAADGSDQPADS